MHRRRCRSEGLLDRRDSAIGTRTNTAQSLGAELEQLADLHERGRLTDAEFATAKSQVLGSSPRDPRGSLAFQKLRPWLVAGLGFNLAVALIVAGTATAVGTLSYRSLTAQNPDVIGQARRDMLATSDALVAWSTASLAGRVVTGLLFVCWLWSLRRHVERKAPGSWRWNRWWAIFGWFVPVAFLFVPYRFLGEISERIEPARHRALRRWWWAAFVAATFASVGATRLASSSDEVMLLAGLDALSGLLSAAAAVLAILLVHRLSEAAIGLTQR